MTECQEEKKGTKIRQEKLRQVTRKREASLKISLIER